MRRTIDVINVFVGLFLLVPLSWAQPAPSNDDPCNAQPLTPGVSCTFQTFDNNNATNSPGVPAPGCANYQGSDVWFSVTVPAGGSLTVDFNTGGITDGGAAAYSGPCNNLSLISCNDDSSPNGLMPLLNLSGLTPGSTIYIRVWEYGGNVEGTFDICVTMPPAPPANDECVGAETVPVNPDQNCGTTVAGTINAATSSWQGNSCGPASDDDDVWYEFTATDTQHSIDLLNVAGSTTDMYFSVFQGTCGAIGTAILCSDPNSAVVTGLTPGNTYYVRVYTWSSTGGQTTTFDICIGTPPPPPTNVDCGSMEPICTDSGLDFTAQSGGPDADVVDPGNNYGCLISQPNPTWFYFEISTAGNLQFDMAAGSDIDYAVWGPYADLAAAQADCGSMPAPIDCSFSISATETANINGAQVGEVYVLLITNYANVTQQITATQTGGNASTDCTIVTCPGADAGSW